MKVTVKLIGPLVYAAGFSEKKVRLPASASAKELLSRIGLKKNRPTIVTRSGKSLAPADALKDGDRVVIAPIYSGG
ncbi:MAG: MoaD/ThiS family protein [Elusimicrobia bacterium]|nr:MoaD/ThiS family protein [Elusimicrobiota bacterium]